MLTVWAMYLAQELGNCELKNLECIWLKVVGNHTGYN